MQPLCSLCLCGQRVEKDHHRDTENTESHRVLTEISMYTSSATIQSSSDPVTVLTDSDSNVVREALKEHGALIVRAGASLSDFENLSDQLITPMVHHSTSTTVERDVVNADGTTSTVNKGMDYIPLHREGSYAPGCPDLLPPHIVGITHSV